MVIAEVVAGEIYLALRQFELGMERALWGLSADMLWKVVNLFCHLRGKADLTLEELMVLEEYGLA